MKRPDVFGGALTSVGALVAICALAMSELRIGGVELTNGRLVAAMIGGGMVWVGLARGFAGRANGERLRSGQVLGVAIAIGLAAGLVEDGMQFLASHVFERGLTFNPHVLWLKPVVLASVFALIGVVLVVAGRGWRAATSARGVVAGFVFLAAQGILLMIPGLHLSVVVALSCLIAVRASASWQRPGALRGLLRSVPWTAGLVLLIGVGVVAWSSSRRPDAVPGRTTGKNVLLIVWDTVRAESLGLYGAERDTTPRLAEFAEHGVVFDRAISPSSWTLPSHAGMFTGLPSRDLFRQDETPLNACVPLRDEHPTLAEELTARGWDTVGVVANTTYCSWAHGLDRGFVDYEDYRVTSEWASLAPRLGHSLSIRARIAMGDRDAPGRKKGGEISESFVSWLDQRGDSTRPFFAFLNYFDAHHPYVPEDRFRIEGGDPRDLYESCIQRLDELFGQLVRELDARGVLEDTVVIVTSDHGEHFGEHGRVGHSTTVYPQEVHVPLVVVAPGVWPAGVRVEAPVSLIDIPATVLDLAGVRDSGLPGVSLTGLVDGDDDDRMPVAEVLVGGRPPAIWQPAYAGYDGGMATVFMGGFQYIRYFGSEPREELFHFFSDPRAERNLINQKSLRKLLGRLRGATGWRKRQ